MASVLQTTISLILILGMELCHAQGHYLGMVDELVPKYKLVQAGNEDIIAHAGETLELECRGAEQGSIKWTFPRKNKPDELLEPTAVVTYEEVTDGSKTYYISRLTVPNVTSEDTGEYECSCGGLTDNLMHVFKRHMGDGVVSKREVYVFVSDPEELFQGAPVDIRIPVTGRSRSYTFLPCAVNDPNTTVELVKEHGYGRMSVIHMDGKKYKFLPKAGLKIDNLSIRDNGAYKCIATEGDLVETREYYLYLHRGESRLVKPVLRTDSPSIEQGMSTSFRCQVLAGKGQMLTLTWWKQLADGGVTRLSGDDRIQIEGASQLSSICSGERSMCSFLRRSSVFPTGRNQYTKWTGKLRVSDAKHSDSGSYFCKATSGGVVTQSDQVLLTVSAVLVHLEDNEGMALGPRYQIHTEQV